MVAKESEGSSPRTFGQSRDQNEGHQRSKAFNQHFQSLTKSFVRRRCSLQGAKPRIRKLNRQKWSKMWPGRLYTCTPHAHLLKKNVKRCISLVHVAVDRHVNWIYCWPWKSLVFVHREILQSNASYVRQNHNVLHGCSWSDLGSFTHHLLSVQKWHCCCFIHLVAISKIINAL